MPIKPYRPTYGNSNDQIERLPNEGIIEPPPRETPAMLATSSSKNIPPGAFQSDAPVAATKAEEPDIVDSKSNPQATVGIKPPRGNQSATKARVSCMLTAAYLIFLVLFAALSAFGVYSYFKIQPKLRRLSILKGLADPLEKMAPLTGNLRRQLPLLSESLSPVPTPKPGSTPSAEWKAQNVSSAAAAFQRRVGEILKTLELAQKETIRLKERLPKNYPEDLNDDIIAAQSLSQRSGGLIDEIRQDLGGYSSLTEPTATASLAPAIDGKFGPKSALFEKLNKLNSELTALIQRVEKQRRENRIFFFY